MDFTRYPITGNDEGRRIDRIARRFLPDQQLSSVYSLIRKGLIRLDGKKTQPGTLAPSGGELWIASMFQTASSPGEDSLLRDDRNTGGTVITGGALSPPVEQKSDISVILETEDLLFLSKPSGLEVHGEGGMDRLVPPSKAALESLSFRTGPLHRLDKDTSGLIAFSRSLAGARWFSQAMAERRLEKYYLGIAMNGLEKTCTWRDADGDGKEMTTIAEPLARCASGSAESCTLIRYRILTGKKHQIRIQSSVHGHPLRGDARYCPYASRNSTFFLHAWQLVLPEDRPHGLPQRLCAPLPPRFKEEISRIFGADVLADILRYELYWVEA